MRYPIEFQISDFRWKDDKTVEYIGYGEDDAIAVAMYANPTRPTGHVREPQQGEVEEAFTKAGGSRALLVAAEKFANAHPRRAK